MKNRDTSTCFPDGENSLKHSKNMGSKRSGFVKQIQLPLHGLIIDGQALEIMETYEQCQPLRVKSSQVVFPAKTLATAEREPDCPENVPLSGSKCLLQLSDPDPFFASLRTAVLSTCEELTGFSPTWNQSTTPYGRLMWTLVPSEHHIAEEGHSCLVTPLASDHRARGNVSNPCVQRRMRLGKQLALSMLFEATPCPFCVGGMMGYPKKRVKQLCNFLETLLYPSSWKSLRKRSMNKSKKKDKI